jgi:hypothetical protein
MFTIFSLIDLIKGRKYYRPVEKWEWVVFLALTIIVDVMCLYAFYVFIF